MLSMSQEFAGLPSTTPSTAAAAAPTTSTLANGMTVVTSPSALSSATVSLTFPHGTSSGNAGSASVVKHLAFKSGASGSTLFNLRAIEDAGATPFSSVTRNTFTLGYTGSPDAVTDLLTYLDISSNTMEPWDVRDARASAALDQSISKTTPERSLQDQIYAAAYGEKTDMGRSAFGAAGCLKSFHSLLGSKGAVLSAAGVSDHAAFGTAAAAAFSASASADAAAYKYTGGECRINAVSNHAHVALAFNGGAFSPVLEALLSLTGSSPMSTFTTGDLVGVYGCSNAETADVMQGAMSASVSAALKADDATLSRAIAMAKANAVFNASASSAASAAANTAAVMTGGAVGEKAVIAQYDSLKPAAVKKALEAAVAGGASVAAVGDLARVDYVKGFKF